MKRSIRCRITTYAQGCDVSVDGVRHFNIGSVTDLVERGQHAVFYRSVVGTY